MTIQELISKAELTDLLPLKGAKEELLTKDGDYVAEFNSCDSEADLAAAALVAHCVNHLPVLIKAVSDYIEGPDMHSAVALAGLRKALKAAENVPE